MQGRTAWVTGGASGIGESIVAALAQHGARVAVLDLKSPDPSAPVVSVVDCDLREESSVVAAAERLRGELGDPAMLVNCAGVSGTAPVAEIETDRWDLVMAVNLRGPMLITRQVVGGMSRAGWGRIVNIASGQAVRPTAGQAAYAASKAGLIALTKATAVEYAGSGVTVNAVAPGMVDTPMTRELWGGEQELKAAAESSAIANPMRALIQPVDVAALVAFLCSDAARYVTGQVLHVNAGSLMPS